MNKPSLMPEMTGQQKQAIIGWLKNRIAELLVLQEERELRTGEYFSLLTKQVSLAALEAEPEVWEIINPGEGTFYSPHPPRYFETAESVFYKSPAPALIESPLPKRLDEALTTMGVSLPESREEFNFQSDRWVQRLIDRVISFSDEVAYFHANKSKPVRLPAEFICYHGGGDFREPCYLKDDLLARLKEANCQIEGQ